MSSRLVAIKPFSDGDPTHKPKDDWTLVENPDIYLRKLAHGWMESKGEAHYGVQYKLDRLPEGYCLFERPRPRDHKIVDRHLYGHPGHKFFDSPNRFLPHFLHLMEHQTNEGCSCTICRSRNTVKLPIGAGPRKREIQHGQVENPGTSHGPPSKRLTDDEGTPDTLRLFLDRLKREKQLTVSYEEPMSMDWRAEHEILTDWLSDVQDQQSWVPRKGEIVLFVRKLDGEISYDQKSKQYLVFDTNVQRFTGVPQWEAAVVGQVPEEPLHVMDLVSEEDKKGSVTTSGFRVEPYPNPNDPNKRLSKQYKYVPLHHIRPFVLWNEYLSEIPEHSWHPTIHNAMTAASTVSLLDKFEFSGTWPNATVLCRALYIGHELICVGDAVRILPKGGGVVLNEVLLVETIKFHIANLDKASDNDNDDGHPYQSKICLSGKIITPDKSQAASEQSLGTMDLSESLPRGLEGYGDWYSRYDMYKSFRVPLTKVLGRCFERDAMMLWLPSEQNTDPRAELNKGLEGVRRARKHASLCDQRIQDGKTWFWGDSRADALDLDTLNGIEVLGCGKNREEDVVSSWRTALRLINKNDSSVERRVLQPTTARSERRPLGKSTMTKAAYDTTDVDSDDDDDDDDGDEQQPSDSMDVDEPKPGGRFASSSQIVLQDSSSNDDLLKTRGGLMDTFRTSKKPRLQPQVVINEPLTKEHRSIIVIDSDNDDDN